MEDYLFQKFNTVVWKTAKKKERKEMSTKTMMQSEKKMGVRAVVQIGMLAAVAVILMLFVRYVFRQELFTGETGQEKMH